MYLIQCIRFGSWNVRRLNRAQEAFRGAAFIGTRVSFFNGRSKERLGIRVRVRDRKCNFRSFRPLLPSPLPRSQCLLISDFFASFLKGETTEIFKLLQFYSTFYLKDINRSPRTRGNGGDLGTKHFPPFGWSFKKALRLVAATVLRFISLRKWPREVRNWKASLKFLSVMMKTFWLQLTKIIFVWFAIWHCESRCLRDVVTDSVESVSISVLNGKLKVQEVLSEDLSLLNLKFCHKSWNLKSFFRSWKKKSQAWKS